MSSACNWTSNGGKVRDPWQQADPAEEAGDMETVAESDSVKTRIGQDFHSFSRVYFPGSSA